MAPATKAPAQDLIFLADQGSLLVPALAPLQKVASRQQACEVSQQPSKLVLSARSNVPPLPLTVSEERRRELLHAAATSELAPQSARSIAKKPITLSSARVPSALFSPHSTRNGGGLRVDTLPPLSGARRLANDSNCDKENGRVADHGSDREHAAVLQPSGRKPQLSQSTERARNRMYDAEFVGVTHTSTSSAAVPDAAGPKRAPFGAQAELSDLFEVAQQGKSVLRGGVEKMLAEKQEHDIAMAQRRRDVARATGQAHRQGAQRLRARKSGSNWKSPQRQTSLAPANELPELLLDQAVVEDVSVVPFPTPRGVMRPSMRIRRLSTFADPLNTLGSDAAEDAAEPSTDERGSILHHISLKTPRSQRLASLKALRQDVSKNLRVQKLLLARQAEFDQKPEDERSRLRDVFRKHDPDDSGTLDPNELVASLAELGLAATTGAEKKNLDAICQEVAILGEVNFLNFCFELVPRARERLRLIRRDALQHEFNMYDMDHSGSLDAEECQRILELLCTGNLDSKGIVTMEKSFASLIAELSDEDGQIGFDAFQDLVERARELQLRIIANRVAAICEQEGIVQRDTESHPDEIVLIHDSFRLADGDHDGLLEWSEIGALLIEYRLFPHDVEEREDVHDLFKKVDTDNDGKIKFSEYLTLVHMLRKRMLDSDEHAIRLMFRRFDKDGSNALDISEVSNLLTEIGIQPKSREEQLEMKKLIDFVDRDRSGDISFTEFLAFVLQLRERLGIMARCRERVVALKLGFNERRVKELRDVFFTLDTEETGLLRPEQLRQAVNILRTPMSPDELYDLTLRHGVHGTCLVDFEGFLSFYHTVAPDGAKQILS